MMDPMPDLGEFSYDLNVPPPAYSCADCGVFGPKLWRESHTSHVILRCAMCAAACAGRVPDLTDSDQIGSYVPAVPDEDGTSWWGYTSVPQAGVEWWYRLPSAVAVQPGRKSMTAAEARAVDAAYAAEKAKRAAADNAAIDAMLASTVLAVEATSYESMSLWAQWCEPRDSRRVPTWDCISLGAWARIGEFGGEPVCVSVSFARIDGSIVAFWECTSIVSHRPTIDAWIASKMPKARRTNATNFAPPVERAARREDD